MLSKLKQCPNCGSQNLWTVRSVVHKTWWIECPHCHWCGKTKLFKWLAILSWNKEKR